MKLYLAPLAGFTDAPFRRMCFEGGADLCYTEMVSAAGLAHGSSPTRHLMETMAGEGPVACQIFGASESDIAFAAREISALAPRRFVELNLNAGCPMTKVTREGAGAALVKSPAKIYRLLKAMTDATDLPVTLKTRLGPRPGVNTVFEILDAAERAGASAIIVHARYTSQLHGGALDFETLAEVVARARIPVVGNGSVVDRASLSAMSATGVDAVMIGRAALAEPGVFNRLKGVAAAPADAAEKDRLFRRHLDYLLAFREQLAAAFPGDHVPSPDGFASVKMHTHLFRYFNGRPGAAALRARLNGVRSLAEIEEILSAGCDFSM